MTTTWTPEPQLVEHLDAAIDEILATQKPNGEFGTEPWISTDQNVLWPLAVAWSTQASRHHAADGVLDAIVRGGLALREAQDEAGQWIFRKKDYSEWGPIRMPWAYSRWIRAFDRVRHAMPDDARTEWEVGLTLGYTGIAAHDMERIHNIPAHHAMGLYCAGTVLERPEWTEQASAFLHRVAEAQSPDGWWAEHEGPVVAYNFVYSDALGAYYAMSGDAAVLPMLERAAAYHAIFTWPNGTLMETVDGRNIHHDDVRLGNPGLTRSAAGRGWTARQHRLYLARGGRFDPDYAASMLAYAEAGPADEPAAEADERVQRLGDRALVQRRAPWVLCLSAFTAPLTANRFGMDRQNFIGLYHDTHGLIAGGGNTKLQPLWSTFTVGDTTLLSHTPGDEDPDFSAPPGLVHHPTAGRLEGDGARVVLDYGDHPIRGIVEVALDGDEAALTFSQEGDGSQPVAAHLTLMPRMGELLRWEGGEQLLDETPIDWTATAPGAIRHGGWTLHHPAGARLRWPALPHNPYRKDGHAEIGEGRVVLTLPLTDDTSATIRIEG